jgi:cytochrome P450
VIDSESNGKDNYISPFGYGIHICPGKKISFMIVNAFFNALKKRKNIIFDKNKISFKRDFFLRPIKK